MEKDRRFDSVYTKKVRAGKRRTYFFDVRQTRGEDYYLTLTESTKKFHGDGFERHKIFLYKEDFNRFKQGLEEAIEYIKTELMPHFDYEEFDRRQEEWEERMASEDPRDREWDGPRGRDNDRDSGRERRDSRPPRRQNDGDNKGNSSNNRSSNDREIEDDDMSW